MRTQQGRGREARRTPGGVRSKWEQFQIACPRCKAIAEIYSVAFRLDNTDLAIKVDGKCHNCDLLLTHETTGEERSVRCAQLSGSKSFVHPGSDMVN